MITKTQINRPKKLCWNRWEERYLTIIKKHCGFCFQENYHGSNTMFLVGVLMSVVGFVFITFTLMALCYRSVLIQRNFSFCIRLVESLTYRNVYYLSTIIFFASPFRTKSFAKFVIICTHDLFQVQFLCSRFFLQFNKRIR